MAIHRRKVKDPNLLSPEKLLSIYQGMNKLSKLRNGSRWKLAAEAAHDRNLLIGSSSVFDAPGK